MHDAMREPMQDAMQDALPDALQRPMRDAMPDAMHFAMQRRGEERRGLRGEGCRLPWRHDSPSHARASKGGIQP